MAVLIGIYDPLKELSNSVYEKLINGTEKYQCKTLVNEPWCKLAVKNFYDFDGSKKSAEKMMAWIGDIDPAAFRLFDNKKTSELEWLKSIKKAFLAVEVNYSEKQIRLITDRFASYPCYVFRQGRAVVFSTSLFLLSKTIERKSINQDAVATLLSYGEVIGNQTLIAEVDTLSAATITSFNTTSEQGQSYWRYIHEADQAGKWRDCVAEVGTALQAAVFDEIQAYEAVSVPLSGGLDSRMLLGMAAKTDKRVDAFTWGVEGCKDLQYASEVCAIAGVPHHQFNFESDYLVRLAEKGIELTEGVTPTVHFHVLPFVNKVNLTGKSVLLDGFAGDATLGGNFINEGWMGSESLEQAAENIWLWRLNGFFSGNRLGKLDALKEQARHLFTELYRNYSGESNMDKAMAFLLDNRVRRITTAGTQIFRSEIIVKQPFMHADVIEVTRKLPHEWRKRHRFYLDVLKYMMPDIAKARWQRTFLPANVPYWMTLSSLAGQRLLGGVWPVSELVKYKSPSSFDEWFRSSLRAFVEEILFNEKSLSRGVLPITELKNVWQLHLEQRVDASNLIGAALTIELFAQKFIDES